MRLKPEAGNTGHDAEIPCSPLQTVHTHSYTELGGLGDGRVTYAAYSQLHHSNVILLCK